MIDIRSLGDQERHNARLSVYGCVLQCRARIFIDPVDALFLSYGGLYFN